jgi:2-polyprenyl-3-methyl-5-hydroxy-6-metoxy-1,4-benzoquinol methylase
MKCRVCGSTDLRFHFKVKGWPLHQCNQCKLIQVTNKPSNEQLSSIYSQSYFSHNKYLDKGTLYREFGRRLDILKSYLIDENAKVLDFGCAQADFIDFAMNKYQFWGYDFSQYAIKKAKEKKNIIGERLFSNNEIDSLFENEQFNAVVLWDVLEHLWDIDEIFKKLTYILKPGGYLVLSTPNIDSTVSKLMGKYWAFMTPPEHLSFFTKETFYYISQQHNLKILEWKTKGKWANVGFIFYKIKRVAPLLIPNFLISLFRTKALSKVAVFVPTFDIQYLVFQKL